MTLYQVADHPELGRFITATEAAIAAIRAGLEPEWEPAGTDRELAIALSVQQEEQPC